MNREILRDSQEYSYWGHCILSGNDAVLRNLYGRIKSETPVLIKTISQLQNLITSDEIRKDTNGFYNPEFLYYWGMTCMGEQSPLILKDLGTAETCFEKIVNIVPKAAARLAYIGLLQSDEMAKDESNVKRLDVLRRWAGMRDIFSSIVLSKITFFQFLQENQADVLEFPARTLRLLDYPCQEGHPVAIRFYNAVMECIGSPEALEMRINEKYIRTESLYDFETSANMQIGCQTL